MSPGVNTKVSLFHGMNHWTCLRKPPSCPASGFRNLSTVLGNLTPQQSTSKARLIGEASWVEMEQDGEKRIRVLSSCSTKEHKESSFPVQRPCEHHPSISVHLPLTTQPKLLQTVGQRETSLFFPFDPWVLFYVCTLPAVQRVGVGSGEKLRTGSRSQTKGPRAPPAAASCIAHPPWANLALPT